VRIYKHHLKLTYFDAHGRGQPIRDAFKLGNIAFEDERIKVEEWEALKPNTPFGALPVLHVDDVCISQSNSILRYVGTLTGLYPKDNPVHAAKVDEILDVTEDFTATKIAPTIGLDATDKEKFKTLREEIANTSGPKFLSNLEKVLEKKWCKGWCFCSWRKIFCGRS